MTQEKRLEPFKRPKGYLLPDFESDCCYSPVRWMHEVGAPEHEVVLVCKVCGKECDLVGDR